MSRNLHVTLGWMGSVCLLLTALTARADVWLDYSCGEGMVLQRGIKAQLHGTAKPSEKITITFRDKTYEITADKIWSKWQAEIDPGEAGGPFPLTIKGNNTIELKNVFVAEMSLGQVFGDGMVLQRGEKAPVFGSAAPGAKITVTFRNKKFETLAEEKGNWRVDVEPGEAGGPFPMTIQGKTAIELKEVYVGEVWLCSGQSNMRWGVSYTKDAGSLVLEPPNQQLRLQLWPQDISSAANHPQKRFQGWNAAGKKAVMEFSGTGYYFGAALQEKLKVPVGLIQSAFDATGIRQWMPAPKDKALNMGAQGDGDLYARQVRCIQPFAIRGVIWYQGEANASKDIFGSGYERPLAWLIEGWRKDWGQGDFPFLYVQLPRIGFGAEEVHNGKLPSPEEREIVGEWARVRDEQRRVLRLVPNVAMAVYYEHTTGMLHPPQKKQAGERLALAARALVYGEKMEYSGPLLDKAERKGEEVVLTFTHAEGLKALEGELRQFEAAGPDGKFQPAKARIAKDTVVLAVGNLQGPLTIRYAYREWPDGNLCNSALLPASPFRLENVK